MVQTPIKPIATTPSETNSRAPHLRPPYYGLDELGFRNIQQVYRNLAVPKLLEHALARKEGVLAANGAFCVETGKYTGRSPNDRFIVDEPFIHDEVHWNKVNVGLSPEKFDLLHRRVLAYIQGKDLYIFDGYIGSDPNYRMSVRIINELAYQNMFVHQMFIRPTAQELESHHADFTIIAVPGLQGDPGIDGINSEAFIVVSFAKKLILVGGSFYSGEMKKSAFSFMNYYMTKRDVLPMHCSANMDDEGNTALFFGLSGTGKTTLSADTSRRLIGDDEHGWSSDGIFNFEGGCYAKTIRLSREKEPEIWNAIRYGALLENVILDEETRVPDYDDDRLTQNTRVAYPIDYIPNSEIPGIGGHPNAVIFLTADAFGVLPPISKLTTEQAIYHFMSGYTSKLAGTERGVTEPEATFSACFGKPFLPLSATVYGEMLAKRLEEHKDTTSVYLINTGWTGGPYGVGNRFDIQDTRYMVWAALNGNLKEVNFYPHPIFKILIPESVPNVDPKILNPKNTWSDPKAYDRQATQLAEKFIENFKRFKTAEPEIIAAGPKLD
ncbi:MULTISPECIES: phosphoenolpyruvate carboxykinase (ATP) [unclassified Roseofilum]|uniref:phosphoenolpyruvate carboxykinase (ATP) n=1 Tax=unclassified Roseofilum TaxID=2620099 RepID=UPI000E99B762|nr:MULTISPECIES: phosphoenolpyruvate carboxykinase (ATP) [unclassified Roseofilum]MBP0008879.1 phosphoenolpyruvate carboxykinase (ATP) [Roseofilum sp. Belize Diploria]MBP0033287.1 phosphoenolpyruvate carboxykinase (ATP) [Roseofilum sp. Belize BBD 4]HBQ97709.1 phosphoenolpyruvate carboxykinase (ATP) [Cyanobacteria bacterium UBA11691]